MSLVPPENVNLRQGQYKLARASALMADSGLDCLQHASRALAAGVAVRRGLWLKHWKVDNKSKVALAATPFLGGKLFGESLEPVLVETSDKKKAMPSGRGDSRRGYKGGSLFHNFFRPYRGSMRGGFSGYRDGNRDRDARPFSFRSSWRSPWIPLYGRGRGNNRSRASNFNNSRDIKNLSSKRELMAEAIGHLLQIQVIEPVPELEFGHGVYSLLFLVPKKDDSWRAILDLKRLNRFVRKRTFHMETLKSIKRAVHQGDWLFSIDLSEAYLHVPVHPRCRRYLRFAYSHQHFQYRALPFGLSSAPRVFTKMMVAVIAHVRQQGVHAYPYLDDILVRSVNQQRALHDVSLTVQVLEDHGFVINESKSQLCPTQILQHLGVVFNTVVASVSLPLDRQHKIRSAISPWMRKKRGELMSLAQILGQMIACLDCTPWARWHARPIQWFLLPYQSSIVEKDRILLVLPAKVRASFLWWLSPALQQGLPLEVPQKVIVTTDASLTGWGAHCLGRHAQGVWEPRDLRFNINWLELKAIRLALTEFHELVLGRHVLIRTDNVTAKAHVNHQGGTRSRALMKEADLLLAWAEIRVLLESRASQRPGECAGGLVKPPMDGPVGVCLAAGSLRLDIRQVGSSTRRSVCVSVQQQTSKVFLQALLSPSGGGGCTSVSVASWSPLRLSAISCPESFSAKGQDGEGGGRGHRSLLAAQTLVLGSGGALDPSSVASPSQGGPPVSGAPFPPRPCMAAPSRLAIERRRLARSRYSREVQDTILASHRLSTSRI
ncbi:uncharacterized protein LOC128328210 [Hemicordylus capensis]|uniref:uncharacterized protein LOC128328210 n=1 Tax=Hemicordylus capensis TaxID=884348 RepID=UPI0023031513|nr:uncharacterized protein LOC128328210 [Hemicordylus capensis]